MSRRQDRLREQEAYLKPIPGNERPNVPPRPINEANRCPGAKYGEHDFSQVHHDDPRGSGLRSVRCWFCSRMSPRCQARADAWRAAQASPTTDVPTSGWSEKRDKS